MSRPTLYLSNWSSHRTPGMHGPGRKFTIMARPRAWEYGAGTVLAVTPHGFEVSAMQRALADRDNADAMRDYREMIEARWTTGSVSTLALPPGLLLAFADGPLNVGDGDTLCCACSVDEARAGRCHRTWAAPFLARAGWRVILDGVEVGL